MSAALRCDGCGTFAVNEPSLPRGGWGDGPLPAGWLRVFVFDRAREDKAGPQPAAEVHECCSRKCAADCLRREP